MTPYKSFETAYCRRIPTSKECLFLSWKYLFSASNNFFEVRESSLTNSASRSIFSKAKMVKGTLIIFEKSSLNICIYHHAKYFIGYIIENLKEYLNYMLFTVICILIDSPTLFRWV